MAIAIQELARAALEVGDLPEARRFVDLGLARLAKEPTLVVMSAYLDERLEDRSESVALHLQLAETADMDPISSRYRYSEWSSVLVHEARDRMTLAADLARPRLGDTLSNRAHSSEAQ